MAHEFTKIENILSGLGVKIPDFGWTAYMDGPLQNNSPAIKLHLSGFRLGMT